MKPSRRNVENAAREQERLAQGKPRLSKYERKHMGEEEYQRLVARERELRTGRGVVTK